MAKKGKKHKRGAKHHIKLATLIASKLIIAFASFLIGLYFGSFVENTYFVLMIALLIAVVIYLLSILNVIKLLKI